ncbi:MAG: HlyD family efflux transporter periplasmic adaptor subunit, partial [Akkermansiaceae bacterium]|nr:HlyD family efflux transporter periplasmic adaptor subunit [Akkermansiaceae bacterium]
MTKRKNNLGRRLVRFLKWAVVLVLVAGAVVLAFLPRPAEVDLGEVTRGPMLLTIDEDGATRIRERYAISAPLGGQLLRVELDPGDAVEKDDLLATLDPGEPDLLDPRLRAQAGARVKAAEASLARAQSQLENAHVEAEMLRKAYERGRTLFAKGNLSAAGMEEAECRHRGAQLAIRAADSAVKVAAFDLEQARAALLHTSGDEEPGHDGHPHFRIKSPIAGRVLRVFQESSTVVAAGSRLMEIGDPADLELRIDVLSQDAVRIRPGQRVILEHWGGAQALNARVRRVEPSAYTKVSALGVDEQRVDIIADLEDAPAEGETLGDGFRVEARVVVWESEDTLRLPAGALFRAGDDWAVYRLAGKHAELVRIEAGHNNG